MRSVEVLNNLNLLCWSLLFMGLRKEWVTKSDIEGYAVSLLSANLDGGDEKIAELASAESLGDDDVRELLFQLGRADEQPDNVEKWRLALLISLSESVLSEEEKVDRLQELYAEFGYPEDMSACSIYSQNSIAPLIAMSRVISSLKAKLVIST